MGSKLEEFYSKHGVATVHRDQVWFYNQLRRVTWPVQRRGVELVIRCQSGSHADRRPSCGINTMKAVFNCLAGETKVITSKGVFPIRKLVGGKHLVLTRHPNAQANAEGRWKEVEFKDFGRQELWEVVLSRNGAEKRIRATADHRWFVRRLADKEVVTQNLLPGHRLSYVLPRSSKIRRTRINSFGVTHGFVFGDGTREGPYTSISDGGSRVHLFGKKDAALEEYFPKTTFTDVETPNGVSGSRITGLPAFFKKLPKLNETPSYILGFLAGYFAADGCVGEGGQAAFASANIKKLRRVQALCSAVGVQTLGIGGRLRQGFGKKRSWIYYLPIINSSVTSDFFILRRHKKRFVAATKTYERLGWVVKSVRPLGIRRGVYCAVVPGEHTFALDGNILTGNCLSCGWKGHWNTLAEKLNMEKLEGLKADAGQADTSSEALDRIGRALTKSGFGNKNLAMLKKADAPARPLVSKWPSNREWRGMAGELLTDLGCVLTRDLTHNVNRIGLPVRTASGTLLGYTCRALDKDVEPKYTPLAPDAKRQKELPAKKALFLIDIAVERRWKTIVLVEGPYDALRLYAFGLPAVAFLGTNNWTEQKASEVSALGFNKVIVLTDNDKSGIAARHRIVKSLRGRVPTVKAVKLPADTHDPGEMSPNQLRWLADKISE